MKVEVIYQDVHLTQIRLSAWNGEFGGAAEIYLALGQLHSIAGAIAGFPASLTDVREMAIGAVGPLSAGGAASLRFLCAKGSGSSNLELQIESAECTNSTRQHVSMILPIEAAALDSFVSQLRDVSTDRSKTAFLRGVPSDART